MPSARPPCSEFFRDCRRGSRRSRRSRGACRRRARATARRPPAAARPIAQRNCRQSFISEGGQRTLRPRRAGSPCNSLSAVCAPLRSRRNSSRRARMVGKSSAARGRFTAFPPNLERAPAFGPRAADADCRMVNFLRQASLPGPAVSRLGRTARCHAHLLRGGPLSGVCLLPRVRRCRLSCPPAIGTSSKPIISPRRF